MSDIAEDMVNGACCSACGVYFEAEHGYPVLCPKCWEDYPKARKDHQKASNKVL